MPLGDGRVQGRGGLPVTHAGAGRRPPRARSPRPRRLRRDCRPSPAARPVPWPSPGAECWFSGCSLHVVSERHGQAVCLIGSSIGDGLDDLLQSPLDLFRTHCMPPGLLASKSNVDETRVVALALRSHPCCTLTISRCGSLHDRHRGSIRAEGLATEYLGLRAWPAMVQQPQRQSRHQFATSRARKRCPDIWPPELESLPVTTPPTEFATARALPAHRRGEVSHGRRPLH
jgi:hypothetical protein